MDKNRLYYGDNLDVLPTLPSASVDLIYLDPPFNSARNYNVIFARHGETAAGASAQIQAFADTWVWTQQTDEQFSAAVTGGLPLPVAEALTAFRTLLGENDAMAYLVNMAPRIVELHRVLKPTGSLYLHCDPTMSHYLKILLDATFGAAMYANEIIWSYGGRGAKAVAKQFPRNHDVIFLYKKTAAAPYKKQTERRVFSFAEAKAKGFRQDEKGRWFKTAPRGDYSDASIERLDGEERIHWTKSGSARVKYFLEEDHGSVIEEALVGDVWTDIPDAMHMGSERLGYPTQKPLALLKRIILASSEPGDVILDPFCGCGTAVDAAQELGRKWIGIDITYIAIDLILKRLMHTHGNEVMESIDISGIPRDAASAQALFDRNPFDFERWAVSQINAQPNEKQVGDKGIDGVARFTLDGTLKSLGQVLVSVKGGKSLNPSMVRDLDGTITQRKADLGVLILQHPPTPGMVEAANHSGSWTHPANGQKFDRVQIITTSELLNGKRPILPLLLTPYVAAPRAQSPTGASPMF